MPYKALIFDVDGTLIDNMMVHHRAWQNMLRKVGLDFTMEQVIAECHGKNLEILERLFGDKYTLEQRKAISDEKEAEYRNVYKKIIKPIDGLIDTLNWAKENGLQIGIGTAGQYVNVNFVLDTLQIRPYFDTIVADVDVVKGKPDPEVFLTAATNMQVQPHECLVFEDSPVGAQASARAGMKAVILTTTHKADEFESYNHILQCIPDYSYFEKPKL